MHATYTFTITTDGRYNDTIAEFSKERDLFTPTEPTGIHVSGHRVSKSTSLTDQASRE